MRSHPRSQALGTAETLSPRPHVSKAYRGVFRFLYTNKPQFIFQKNLKTRFLRYYPCRSPLSDQNDWGFPRQGPPRPCRGRPPRSLAASGDQRGIVFRFGFAGRFYNFKFGFVGEFVRREKPSPSRLRRATSPGVRGLNKRLPLRGELPPQAGERVIQTHR